MSRSHSTAPFVRPAVWLCAVALLSGALLAASASAAARSDRYLEGYLTAVIERDLGLEVASIRVKRGRAVVVVEDLAGESPDRVAEVIARVEGIERVEVRARGDDAKGVARSEPEDGDGWNIEVLPGHELFGPLIADPRQPHFSAVYQWYLNDDELTRVGSATFGETFALLGGEIGDGRWELGLLGGVFSIFDLDAASLDLVNSDFLVAPTLSWAEGPLSAQLRVYHQSSHLGDEFLLRNRVDRVNLSYEGVDLIGSAQVHPVLRIYGGGGVIVHSEPDLHPLSVQVGAELRSPVAFLDDLVRPLAAFDFQAREENDWREEIGAAAGIEIANPDVLGMRLMILATYFRGNSPNGQFFERRIENIGVGTHLFF